MSLAIRSPQLYRQMKRAVAKSQPEKLPELEQILASYTGDPRLLEIFLQRFGSDNPYEAAARAELKEVRFRTPEELKERGELAVSESGHRLLQQVYLLQDRYSGELWKSGFQAIMKIMQAFGSGEQKEYYQRLGEKAEKQQVRTTGDLVTSLEEVLQDPDRLTAVQSVTDRRKIFHILGLNQELQKRLLLLEELRYGQSLPEEQSEFLHLVGSEKGGTFLGWFERELEQEPNQLPEAIREMYLTLKTKSLLLDEKDYRQILSCLLVYAANHRYIRTEAAIGSYKQDFNYLLTLPRDHELFKKHGPLQVSEIDGLLSQPEITFLEAARIFELYPIDKVRLEMNKTYAHQFPEFSLTLEELKPLFVKDGAWLEDSLDVSLPLTRLKKTLYFAALRRDDFLPVRDLLRVQTLAPGERMWKALSMREFKKKVDGVAVAGRKIASLRGRLERNGVTVPDWEKAEELAGYWKQYGLRGEHDLVENFAAEHGLSYAEFWKRFAVLQRRVYLPGKAPDIAKEERRHQAAREVGLYSPKLFSSLLPVLEEAKQLTPYEEALSLCGKAKIVLANPLVQNPEVVFIPAETAEYLTPEEMTVLHTLAALEKRLSESDEQEGKKEEKEGEGKEGRNLSSLLAQREELQNRIFYRGHIEPGKQEKQQEKPEKRGRLVVERDKYHDAPACYEQIFLRYHRGGEALNLHLFQAAGLQPHLQQYQAYVPAAELANPPDFLLKIKFLTSRNAQPLLAKAGYALSRDVSWENAQDLRPQHYVHPDLPKTVEEMYTELESVFSYEQTVIKSSPLEFSAAALYQPFTVLIHGTLSADEGKFRAAFPGFDYQRQEQCWKSRKPMAKGWIGLLTEKIRDYNERHQGKLRVEVTRAG